MSTGSAGVPTARVLITVIAATGVALAGCGSEKSTATPSSTPAAASSAPATTGAPQSTTTTVQADDMKFSPAAITVPAGSTVTWKFSDKVPHAVQGIGDAAMGVNSPILTQGEWSHTFTTPGTYRYMCPLHPEMRGTVTVQ
ncbi:plastocyanin [Nocardia transvalensis]|uniref:Plastocyanin n=1 Tax=Nocardia transvalensis TaxID=37333 RepID=A0A7W9PF20_9NOCA|nr:plastocyanin/azurin family copper-binding protein [Nocardia transvalensis]MBB5914695.1 plastocyanin [Nocardia transvalensis]